MPQEEVKNIILLLTCMSAYLWCFPVLWLRLHFFLLVRLLVWHHHHRLFIFTQGSSAEEVWRSLWGKK